MPRNPTIEFDPLKMYFGEPYVIDLEGTPGSITVYTPTIGNIVEIGETRFYSTLNIFVCNTTQYRVPLWEMGVDWNIFPDFHLFAMLYKSADPEVTKLLFGNLDFQKFEPLGKRASEDAPEELILWNEEDGIEINANVHNHFSQYIRNMFAMNIEEKITQNETLKGWYINKDKRAAENKKKKEESGQVDEPKSNMQSIISSCVNHPGFKYKLHELKDVGVCEFYDSVKRLQIYEQSTALMKGMYSGFIDGSKIKPNDYNFMREI